MGLPYGRLNPSAFAELYHGGTDTTGFVHVAIDCDPATTATNSNCTYDSGLASSIDVGVTLGNSTAAPFRLAAFGFEVDNP